MIEGREGLIIPHAAAQLLVSPHGTAMFPAAHSHHEN
jgi:hypothetical protein